MPPQRSSLFYTFFIMLVVPLSGLGVDIYLPSLPAVGDFYHVDKTWVQLSISTYMYGLALTQLVAGPISDRCGRRYPVLIAMALFVLISVALPFSQTIQQLLVLRFIQGVMAAATVVPCRSIAADVFEGRERDKVINYMALAWSIAHIIAPLIGGYLQHYFGWESNFYCLSLYGALIFLIALLFLPETSKYHHPLNLANIVTRYGSIIINREFLIGLFINGLLYSIIIIFSVVGPYMIQVDLGLTPIEFGHMALILGTGLFLGSFTNRFLLGIQLERKEKLAFTGMLIIAIVMLLLAIYKPLNIINLVVPIFFMLWLGGIVFPSIFARNFAMFPTVAASANALFSGLLFFIAATSASLATYLKNENAAPIACAYIGIILICFAASGVRHRKTGIQRAIARCQTIIFFR